MKKTLKSKKLLILIAVLILLLAAVTVIAVAMHHKKCYDIIGDGYAMGTDEKPVVIGNSCDK